MIKGNRGQGRGEEVKIIIIKKKVIGSKIMKTKRIKE